MCGRISLYTPPSRLARFFEAKAAAGLGGEDLEHEPELEPSWNVAPSRDVLMVVARREHPAEEGPPTFQRLLVPVRWGLVPFWAKDPTVGNRMINARAETVATQPAFRRAFERRRCLVAADGFYEWKPPPTGRPRGSRKIPSQPWYYRRHDGQPLALAGLWETWRPEGRPDDVLRTCTIVVTEAGPDVAPVHDRMPVIVEPGDWDEWLGVEEVAPEALAGLLTPSPEGSLVAHPVDPRMSHPEVDGPEIVEAYTPAADGAEGDGQEQLSFVIPES